MDGPGDPERCGALLYVDAILACRRLKASLGRVQQCRSGTRRHATRECEVELSAKRAGKSYIIADRKVARLFEWVLTVCSRSVGCHCSSVDGGMAGVDESECH